MTLAVCVVLLWPHSEVVYRNDQPSTVTYPDGSPHHLGLVRMHTLSGRESYDVVVGRDPALSYGYRLGIGSDFGTVDATEWTTSGVRVRFNSGRELFVPVRLFEYGR